MPKKIPLHNTIDDDLKKRLEAEARERRTTISALITEYALTLKPTQAREQLNLPKL